ncbi:hypothetical protein QCA50_003685 [Cerrena zonata]|uniref:Uncharacterized protein n=1 Tax=Cerrena zonata TaxID=2478898 RepID=A0AAW0GQJ0_9APHY
MPEAVAKTATATTTQKPQFLDIPKSADYVNVHSSEPDESGYTFTIIAPSPAISEADPMDATS